MIFQKTSYREISHRGGKITKAKLFIAQLSHLQTAGRIKVTLEKHNQIFFLYVPWKLDLN